MSQATKKIMESDDEVGHFSPVRQKKSRTDTNVRIICYGNVPVTELIKPRFMQSWQTLLVAAK